MCKRIIEIQNGTRKAGEKGKHSEDNQAIAGSRQDIVQRARRSGCAAEANTEGCEGDLRPSYRNRPRSGRNSGESKRQRSSRQLLSADLLLCILLRIGQIKEARYRCGAAESCGCPKRRAHDSRSHREGMVHALRSRRAMDQASRIR